MVRKNMKAVADRVTTIVNDANAEVVFVTGEIPFAGRSDRGPARARLRVVHDIVRHAPVGFALGVGDYSRKPLAE
jgi:hypothetical protein